MKRIASNQEIEIRRIESETASRSSSQSSMGGQHYTSHVKVIKLPVFDETTDDLDLWLGRFERECGLYGVQPTEWSAQLGRLLKGTALEIFQRIPLEKLSDYSVLKYALLKRFQLTEGGYRKRFKESQMQSGETPDQFVARLRQYLTKWRDLAGLEATFEGMEMLLLKDQFFVTCSKELRTFLKERGKMSLEDMASCAEHYLDAHPDDKGNQLNNNVSWKNKKNKGADHSESKKEIERKSTNDQKPKNGCYICGSLSHKMKDCNKSKTADSNRSNIKCFVCGGDHKMAQCPRKKNGVHKAAAMEIQTSTSPVVSVEDEYPTLSKTVERRHEDEPIHMCGRGNDDVTLSCGCRLPVVASACINTDQPCPLHSRIIVTPTRHGMVNGKSVECMRDTGCSTVVVRHGLIEANQLTGKQEACVLIDGVVKYYPTAIIDLDTPFFKGKTKALCMKNPLHDVIIGNITGARVPTNADFEQVSTELHAVTEPVCDVTEVDTTTDRTVTCAAVQTRAMVKADSRPMKSLKIGRLEIDNVSVESLRQLQNEDESLRKYWQLAKGNKLERGKVNFVIKKGLLYRKYCPGDAKNDRLQLMVPENLRRRVMEVAHDGLLSGHLSNKKTLDRVMSNFHWPGLCDEIKRYCWSCDRCQRNISKGQVKRAPLGKLPLIGVPFDTVCIDIIGAISPASERGHRYILTLIDVGSRYPDAVALKDIHTSTVADALLDMYSRVGIPRRVHSDRGSQFTSEMMAEVNRLLSIRSTTSTPYHAMGNGLIENCNKTIKNALKKMATERIRDWDRYIAPLLFAIRDAPQASTGFSPFELIYGRTVRGPMSILKELWTEDIEEPEVKTTYQYVIDLRDKIEATCQLAQEELAKVQGRNQKYYNRKAKPKDLKIGDMALLLLPTEHNKLMLHWRGPFRVVDKIGEVDYRIEMPTGKIKTFHANMLKKYHERESSMPQTDNMVVINEAAAAVACVIEDCDDVTGDETCFIGETEMLPLYNVVQKETIDQVQINPELNGYQKRQAMSLLMEYADIFSDVPKVTNLIEHRIQLTRQEPVRCKMYPVPYKLQETIDKEIKDMESMNIVERSDAAYSSPLVIVKKADGSNRVCVNFKLLNSISVFDPEPMMSADDIFPKLAGSQYYSKFDFSKGYWQIPMSEDSKDYTSFATTSGLRRFRVMPFGLVNAGSTYNRMMRKMLEGSRNLENYLDDVLGHSKTWNDQLLILRDFFERVRKANLSLKPSKCQIGFTRVEFLGHTLTGDTIEPKSATLEKILDTPRPTSKKQVRALLGMVGFYRKFIPDCSTLTAPLSDLTTKRSSNQVKWGDEQEEAFVKLRQLLSRSPILKLPDLNRPFLLQTDSSDLSVGAVLLQEWDGIKHPVAYASRKLLSRERNYTVGERECLAVIWAVQKFSRFLTANHFTLETDHRPLECLNTVHTTNPRIMRWGLALQSFSFTVRYIKGSDNVLADCLSRI